VTIHGATNNAFLDTASGTCTGWNDFEDISIGTEVIITGAASETVALGELGLPLMRGDGATRECEIQFVIPDVPHGERFYGVQIAQRDVV